MLSLCQRELTYQFHKERIRLVSRERERESKLQRLHMTTNGGGVGIRHAMSGSYDDQGSYLTWYKAIALAPKGCEHKVDKKKAVRFGFG